MVFLNPGQFFVSHRTHFQVQLLYNIKGVVSMGLVNAATGFYHSASYAGFLFFLAPVIALVMKLVRRESIFKDKLLFALGAIFVVLGLLTTFWSWEKLGFLYRPGALLTQINFSRFHHLLPLSGFVLMVYAFKVMENRLSQGIMVGLMVLGIGWQYKLYYDLHHYAPGPYKGQDFFTSLSYHDYYSPELFGSLRKECHDIAQTDDYNVLGFGIQPAILQYNGFNTLDSYQNFYPLKYEQDFNQIMGPELQKCPDLLQSTRFTIHNMCYLYSCEVFHQPEAEAKNTLTTVQEFLLDPDAIQHLRGKFIISRYQVLDFGTDRIREVRHHAYPDSRIYKDIYLYQVF
jgi:hypothetical protein